MVAFPGAPEQDPREGTNLKRSWPRTTNDPKGRKAMADSLCRRRFEINDLAPREKLCLNTEGNKQTMAMGESQAASPEPPWKGTE